MVNLGCSAFEHRLADYMENLSPPGERAAMEAHRNACPSCAAVLADYRAIPGIVRDATRAEMSPEARAQLRRLLAHAWRRRD